MIYLPTYLPVNSCYVLLIVYHVLNSSLSKYLDSYLLSCLPIDRPTYLSTSLSPSLPTYRCIDYVLNNSDEVTEHPSFLKVGKIAR